MTYAPTLPIPQRAFYFLRHGEADWNVERRCIGQLDRPLTERGRAQALAARALCAALPISAIFHSPLSRAADTAALVADGRCPLTPEAGLQEAHLGVFQGAREDDPANPFIRDWITGRAIEGAETYEFLKTRVATAVARILTSVDGTPLLVAHAGVYHALRDVMGAPVGRVHHCTPYRHAYDGTAWRIEVVGTPP